MQLSTNGLNQITKREGVILHAYRDSVGVWTIGTGHTTAAGPPTVKSGMTITQAQNDQILLQDLQPIVTALNKAIKVKVTQNQFDACVSIAFNVGPKFYTSTCIKKLNQGDVKGAANAIMLWNKPSEIIGRRNTELKQFLTPDPSPHATAGAIVIAGTAAAATTPHHYWPWIIGGIVVAVIGLYAIHLFNSRKVTNVQQSGSNDRSNKTGS